MSFYMHREVATAGVQEKLLGDHQGLSRDRVNPSYSPYIPHSARHHDWERLWQGSCRDWLATVVCREKTPVIRLPTVLRPATDDITVSKMLDHTRSSHTDEINRLDHPASHPGMCERGLTAL